MKRCFREPIVEIFDAAKYLDAAVSAYISGNNKIADELFRLADNKLIYEWTDSVWGKNSTYVIVNKQPKLHTNSKEETRMPTTKQKKELQDRDGCHCRFCGMPVIRADVRKHLHKAFPGSVRWGRSNDSQHAAFQCMWLQYDHVEPHSSGGTNELDNLIITCAACNFGKWNYTLEELDLYDPRDFKPVISQWDGLERTLEPTNVLK